MRIKIEDTKLLNNTTLAFANQNSELLELYSEKHPFYDLNNAIKGKSDFDVEKRKLLVNTLKKQYQNSKINLENYKNVKENIEKLSLSNTYTVCTGQQIHPFLGPMLVHYKILQCLSQSQVLNEQYPALNFVPVFWMASEDHDFDEIKNTQLFGQNYYWNSVQKGPVGRFQLNDFQPTINEIKLKLENDVDSLNLFKQLALFYEQSDTLSEATFKLVNFLYSEYGLLCLNPDDKELKASFKQVVFNDVVHEVNHEKFIEQSNKLALKGYKLQLKSKSINFFSIKGNERHSINKINEVYEINGLKLSKDELINDVVENTENYSPNAVMRPVYQEFILPNVVYIGGNAEINYWLQLSEVFAVNNIIPCHLKLRKSIWITNKKIEEYLQKNQINVVDFLLSETDDEILALIDEKENKTFKDFKLIQKELINELHQMDKNYANEFLEQFKKMNSQLKKIDVEMKEKNKVKHQEKMNQIKKLKSKGFEKNNIQERQKSVLEFYLTENQKFNLVSKKVDFSIQDSEILAF